MSDRNGGTAQPPDDQGQVREDRGGWISGPSLSEDEFKLAGLRERFPRWKFWRGQHTRAWWACPPPGGVQALLSADDLDGLAGMVADVETWESGS